MAIDRKAVMESTLDQIKKQMPNVVLDKYKNYGGSLDVECVSTGSLAVDAILGGGAAKGRILNLFGHTSSGKTTLALTIIAEIQKSNPEANVLYIDAENALDPSYAKALGVNLDEVYIIQPDCGEDGYTVAEMMIASGVLDIAVIDSIASMVPKAILSGEMGEQAQIGVGARLDTQGFAKIFAKANKTKTIVIAINQLVEDTKINKFASGDKVSGNKYQPGGQYLKFYFTHMVEITRIGHLESGGEIVTNQIQAYTRKNKIAPPYRAADFYITFGKGLDLAQEAVDLGVKTGFIEKTARTYIIKGQEKGVAGRPAFVQYLNDNPEILGKLRKDIAQELKKVTGDITIKENKEAPENE